MTREEALVKATIAMAAITDIKNNYKDELGRYMCDERAQTPIETIADLIKDELQQLMIFLQQTTEEDYLWATIKTITDRGKKIFEEEEKDECRDLT